jgi:outer membrane protein TolC
MSITPLRATMLVCVLMPAFAGAASLTLDQALEFAVQRSASTRAARAEVTSAAEIAHAAGQLPDPTLQVGIDNLPVQGSERFSSTAESMTMKRIGIGQEWVSHDKRHARQAAADAMVGRQSVSAGVAAADTRLQTALAYLDAWYAGELLKLMSLDEHHAHEELEAAKARFSSSTGSAQEVLAATSSSGIFEDQTADARQAQAEAATALQRWTGTTADELAAPVLPIALTEAAYVESDPAVMAARSDIEFARRDADVTAAERHANWSWQVSYGQRSGYPDLVSVGVSIPLQIAPAQRQDRLTAAKVALIAKAEAQLDDATRAAAAQYRSLSGDATRLAARIERYRRAVIEPARQRTDAALAGYRSNQTTFAALFDARHMEVEAQRRLLTLQRDLARTQTQLAYRPLAAGDRP